MNLPIGAGLALAIILLVAACETMNPTEGASPPADLVEEPDDAPAGGGGGNGGGY